MIEICNICGSKVSLLTSEQLYWSKYSHLKSFHYRCDNCWATVWYHWNTTEPFWTLADKATKNARHKYHELLDPLWKCEKDWDYKSWTRWNKRRELYAIIANEMKLSKEETHFWKFNIEQCRVAYKIILKYINLITK